MTFSRFLGLAGLTTTLLLSGGCSSDETPAGGAATCTPGKQEPCTCSDGRSGNQTCEASGRAFSECACSGGGAGGNGGSAGVVATGGVAGDGGTGGAGATGVTGGSGGAAGTSGATGGAGGAVNCPDNLTVDCSGECMTPRPECAFGCTVPGSEPVPVIGNPPVRIRLPSPSNSADCCAPITHMVRIDPVSAQTLRFTVSYPWRMVGREDRDSVDYKICAHNSLQCIVRTQFDGLVYVFTDDPNAPPTDVLVEVADACP